ncbi:hypothetical protein J6590_063233 [Homalodisca vitripennis]|nr:hypothetical protein J6590_063233 [Homalodisca vitripennis]
MLKIIQSSGSSEIPKVKTSCQLCRQVFTEQKWKEAAMSGMAVEIFSGHERWAFTLIEAVAGEVDEKCVFQSPRASQHC